MSVEKYEVYVRLPLICGWGAQAFGRLPLKNAVLITSIADAALHYFTENNMRVFQAAKQFGAVLLCTRVVILCWTSGYLLVELSKRVSFLPITAASVLNTSAKYLAVNWIGTIGAAALAGKMVSYINAKHQHNQNMALQKLGESDPDLKTALQTVKIEYQKSFNEAADQWLLVMQIAVGVALVAISESKAIFAAQLASNLYTLAQITKHNWLQIKKEFAQDSYNTKGLFTYQPLLFRDNSKPSDETCSICLDVPTRRFYFCKTHSYDLSCLLSLFIKEMDKFRIVNAPVRVSHSKSGSEIGATYEVYAIEDDKPKCPECRNAPSQNELMVKIWDNGRQKYCNTKITWLNYQPGQKITVKIQGSSNENVDYVYGTLSDKSYVYLKGDQSMIETTLEVTVISTGVVDDDLSLNCKSEAYERKIEIYNRELTAIDPGNQDQLNEYNRVKRLLLNDFTIDELVGDGFQWVVTGEEQYINVDEVRPLVSADRLEEFDEISDESIDEIKDMIDPAKLNEFQNSIKSRPIFDDEHSAPAVIAKINEIAALINPERIKPLVQAEFHDQIDQIYSRLMTKRAYWSNPATWSDQEDSDE